MLNDFLKEILSFLTDCDFGVVFLSFLAVAMILFVVETVACTVNRGKVKSIRILFGVLLSATYFVFIGFVVLNKTLSAEEKFFLSVVFCALSVALYLPCALIEPTSVSVNDGQRELIKALDRKINAEKEECIENHCEKAVSDEITNKDENEGINFSHVKNVIQRLKFYPINAMEKREINELNRLIVKAEEHSPDREQKTEISEKLSTLLKIMSKYSV